MKLISSPIALDLLLALTQRHDGARLSELAHAADVPLSTAQTAVQVLLADGIADRERVRRPRYRLRDAHPARHAIVQLAARHAPPEHALDVVLRANASIEFAARDREGYLVVEHPLADPRDLVALERLVEAITADRGRPNLNRYSHQDLVERLRDDLSPRSRAQAAKLVKGSLARSFPVHAARGHRGRSRGRPRLGRLSQRALAAVARTYRLRRIQLFGSAARDDLGPASDVDVLVEPRGDAPLSLLDLAHLEADLEAVFDRHVDLATPGSFRPDARARVEREAVTLIG